MKIEISTWSLQRIMLKIMKKRQKTKSESFVAIIEARNFRYCSPWYTSSLILKFQVIFYRFWRCKIESSFLTEIFPQWKCINSLKMTFSEKKSYLFNFIIFFIHILTAYTQQYELCFCEKLHQFKMIFQFNEFARLWANFRAKMFESLVLALFLKYIFLQIIFEFFNRISFLVNQPKFYLNLSWFGHYK